jgi:hypothetical protein
MTWRVPSSKLRNSTYSPASIAPRTYRTERLLPEARSYCTKIYRSLLSVESYRTGY